MLPKPGQARQDKVAKVRAAYAAGSISREVYEFNLRSLGVEPEPEGTSAPVVEDERIEKLHDAYHAGRLSRELYERNVRSLGREPVPEPEEETAESPPPDAQSARVAKAFEAAFEESRLASEVQEQDVAVGGAYAPPPAVPTPEVRAAKVREAYAAGRISRETYERNLRALGAMEPVNPPIPPPADEQPTEPAAVRTAPLENPLSPEPSPARRAAPADVAARVERLNRVYGEGKMTREIYEANLARAYETVEPRLAQLRVAFEQGRIPKDVYDVNVRRLLAERSSA